MDRLQRIFELQEKFNSDLIKRRGLEGQPMEAWIQRQVLATISELSELLDEVNFKWWKNPKPVDEDRVREELVDVLHFFVSMCLSAGMDAQELYERYCAKNQENFDRQYGRSEKQGYALEENGGKITNLTR